MPNAKPLVFALRPTRHDQCCICVHWRNYKSVFQSAKEVFEHSTNFRHLVRRSALLKSHLAKPHLQGAPGCRRRDRCVTCPSCAVYPSRRCPWFATHAPRRLGHVNFCRFIISKISSFVHPPRCSRISDAQDCPVSAVGLHLRPLFRLVLNLLLEFDCAARSSALRLLFLNLVRVVP